MEKYAIQSYLLSALGRDTFSVPNDFWHLIWNPRYLKVNYPGVIMIEYQSILCPGMDFFGCFK